MNSSIALALFTIISIIDASVDFSNSTLYDVYDFVGEVEVHIWKCDFGCLIFASTLGAFPESPDNVDPFARNLFVRNNDDGSSYSVTSLASKIDDNLYWKDLRKVPLEIQGPANISVLNTNAADAIPNTMFLYVIEMSKAEEFSYYNSFDAYTYAVYDPNDVAGRKLKLQAEVVTFFSSHLFTVKADKGGMWLDITARLTGFDNNAYNNEDDCPIVFHTPTTTSSPGLHLQVNSPMMSFLLWRNGDLKVELGVGNSDTLDLSEDGFITSPGYNGCPKLSSDGFQNARSPLYQKSAEFNITSEDYYQADIDVLPFIDNNHYVRIIDNTAVMVNNIFGTQEKKLNFPKTKAINVAWADLPDSQGFLMKYSTTPTGPKTTTREPTTTTKPSTTVPKIPTTTKGQLITTKNSVEEPKTTTNGVIPTTSSPLTITTSSTNSLSLNLILVASFIICCIY